MAVKSLRNDDIMDHTYFGVRVSEMDVDEIKAAKAKGLKQDVIDLYHGPGEDVFEAAYANISKVAEGVLREAYSDLDVLREDAQTGILQTTKGLSQKAAKRVVANLKK